MDHRSSDRWSQGSCSAPAARPIHRSFRAARPPTRRTMAPSLGKMPTTSVRRLISPLKRLHSDLDILTASEALPMIALRGPRLVATNLRRSTNLLLSEISPCETYPHYGSPRKPERTTRQSSGELRTRRSTDRSHSSAVRIDAFVPILSNSRIAAPRLGIPLAPSIKCGEIPWFLHDLKAARPRWCCHLLDPPRSMMSAISSIGVLTRAAYS